MTDEANPDPEKMPELGFDLGRAQFSFEIEKKSIDGPLELVLIVSWPLNPIVNLPPAKLHLDNPEMCESFIRAFIKNRRIVWPDSPELPGESESAW